jgi:hypothetical protein
VRYALIGVAIGAFLLLGWIAGVLLLDRLDAPPDAIDHSDFIGFLVLLALVMANAAVGLVRRRAWAADLLSVAAFVCSLPIAALLVLSGLAPSPDNTSDPSRLVALGAIALALSVAVLARRLGRAMRLEMAAPAEERR